MGRSANTGRPFCTPCQSCDCGGLLGWWRRVVNPHEAGVIAAGRRSHHASSSRRASRCAVAVDARLWHHEDRSPTHGYEPTREAAMAAFREELAAK
jgi:hypothetical protein